MQQILLEAQTLTRNWTWLPYRPARLLEVIANSHVRLVQNAEQLLEVVIESLRRLEATFHDETPVWREVWNRLPLWTISARFNLNYRTVDFSFLGIHQTGTTTKNGYSTPLDDWQCKGSA
jgi:hypothetical protein